MSIGEQETAAERLEELRLRISELDEELIRVIGERRGLAIEIGRLKAQLGLPVMDPAREARVVRRVAERAREAGVDEEMARDVIWRIISSARSAQDDRPLGWPGRPPP
jgi:chorismate mutase